MKPPLQNLSQPSRNALIYFALLDEDLPLDALAALKVDPEALGPLFDQHLIAEGGEAHTASLETDVDELLEALSWSETRSYSRELADELLKRGRGSRAVGRLLARAQDFDRARSVYRKTAKTHCERGDYREAVDAALDALDLWPEAEEPEARREFLMEAVRCARNCSDLSLQRRLLEQAVLPDLPPAEASELYSRLAEIARQQAGRAEAARFLERAAALADLSGDQALAARTWAALSGLYALISRPRSALSAADKALERVESPDSPQGIEYAAGRANLLAACGRHEEARAVIHSTLKLAINSGIPELVTLVYRRHANVKEQASDYQGYRDQELEALKQCRLAGDEQSETMCWGCVSYAYFRLGQWEESLEALDTFDRGNPPEDDLQLVAHAVRCCIACLRGNARTADQERAILDRLIPVLGGDYMCFFVLGASACQAFFAGNEPECKRCLEDMLVLWSTSEDRHDCLFGLMPCMGLAVELGDRELSARFFESIQKVFSVNEINESRAALEIAEAEMAWSRGQADRALDHFAVARRLYRDNQLLFETAWTGWRETRVAMRTGGADLAEEARREAREGARALKMRPLLAALDIEDLPGAGTPNWLSALTKRQREVLELAAGGRTDKEIASELGVSVRTAEMHMGAVLEKLNCRGRSEAVRKWAKRS